MLRLVERPLIAIIMGLVAGSCTTPASLDSMAHEVVNVRAEAQVKEHARVSILVTVENTGTESLFYTPCGDVLDRAKDSEWRGVWYRICSLVPTPRTEILPGEQLELEWDVSPREEAHAGAWTEPVAGMYRVGVLALSSGRGNLPDSVKFSEPFELRVE